MDENKDNLFVDAKIGIKVYILKVSRLLLTTKQLLALYKVNYELELRTLVKSSQEKRMSLTQFTQKQCLEGLVSGRSAAFKIKGNL